MSEKTGIEWADSTWSPWRGCTKVSAGCAHCYAETLSKRNPAVFGEWGKGKPRVINKNWNEPVKWHRNPFVSDHTWVPGLPNHLRTTHRARVFPSLCDWLDEEVPIEWLEKFIELIHKTENLNWLLLTKRPENFVTRLRDVQRHCTVDPLDIVDRIDAWISGERVYHNVWIGTSVEDQPNMDRRGPELIKIPAKLRFLSMEPLLGPVNNIFLYRDDGITGLVPAKSPIKWVIVGGESGPGARPCNVEWIRDIVRQCAAASVPCFVKQLGANVVQSWDNPFPWINPSTFAVKMKHPKGGDPDEWPEDLRVRQMPEVKP